METENMTIETIKTVRESITTEVKAECGDLTLTAQVTKINGEVSGVDQLQVSSPDVLLWSGYANPNIGGSFHATGRELDVITMITAFLAKIKSND